jgi:hypothetical protein
MMLAAVVLALGPWPGASWRWLSVGTVLGIAALCRQFALVVTPAFAFLVIADARNERGRDWPKVAVPRIALLTVPVAVAAGVFQWWYATRHGATIANANTWRGIRPSPMPALHALAVWHYLGLWALPAVLALAVRRRLRGLVSRRSAVIGSVLLLGYSLFAWIETYCLPGGAHGSAAGRLPTMPYLGNIVYLVGAGPLTLSSSYNGLGAYPHRADWIGYPLTLATIPCAIVAAVWIRRSARSAIAFAKGLPSRSEPIGRSRARLLLLGLAALYLSWVLGTSAVVYDRYLLPVLPVAVWIALDALPAEVVWSSVTVGALLVTALLSAGATREYLAWNGARAAAVHDLQARGVRDTDVDGGFEVNGPRFFEEFVRRTGQLENKAGTFWVENARYRLAFGPLPDCREIVRYPFWTWPGTGERAIVVLDCGAQAQ